MNLTLALVTLSFLTGQSGYGDVQDRIKERRQQRLERREAMEALRDSDRGTRRISKADRLSGRAARRAERDARKEARSETKESRKLERERRKAEKMAARELQRKHGVARDDLKQEIKKHVSHLATIDRLRELQSDAGLPSSLLADLVLLENERHQLRLAQMAHAVPARVAVPPVVGPTGEVFSETGVPAQPVAEDLP